MKALRVATSILWHLFGGICWPGNSKRMLKTETYQDREPTAVEAAIAEKFEEGKTLLARLARTTEVSAFRPELQGAVFCGHLVADLDSIAGAIGASLLYGGKPARASEVNLGIEYALMFQRRTADTGAHAHTHDLEQYAFA
eukprot:1190803-Prorocentrum_minimum.AAC.2